MCLFCLFCLLSLNGNFSLLQEISKWPPYSFTKMCLIYIKVVLFIEGYLLPLMCLVLHMEVFPLKDVLFFFQAEVVRYPNILLFLSYFFIQTKAVQQHIAVMLLVMSLFFFMSLIEMSLYKNSRQNIPTLLPMISLQWNF